MKVILQNAYLTHAEKVLGCQLVEEAGARRAGVTATAAILDEFKQRHGG